MFIKEVGIDHSRHFLGQDAVFFTKVVVVEETSGVCSPRAAVQVRSGVHGHSLSDLCLGLIEPIGSCREAFSSLSHPVEMGMS